jgi:hypothetical protein
MGHRRLSTDALLDQRNRAQVIFIAQDFEAQTGMHFLAILPGASLSWGLRAVQAGRYRDPEG